jgi:threonine dehydratase
VEVRVLGREAAETEHLARLVAAEREMTYISPYNDLDVIVGQGTMGEEILRQLEGRPVDAAVAAVGGGGLISGVGAAIKSVLPGVRIIGASLRTTPPWPPRSGPAESSRPVPCRRSAIGTAGGIEEGSITLPLCTELVDEWILVEEPEICSALRFLIDTQHQLAEGAAAVAIAAALKAGHRSGGQEIVIVSCGASGAVQRLRPARSRGWSAGPRQSCLARTGPCDGVFRPGQAGRR